MCMSAMHARSPIGPQSRRLAGWEQRAGLVLHFWKPFSAAIARPVGDPVT